MDRLGNILDSDGKFFAKVDTSEGGVRFKMVGPPRANKDQAYKDLVGIRAAANGEATRLEFRAAPALAQSTFK